MLKMLAILALLALPVNSGKKDQRSDLPKADSDNQAAPTVSFVNNETSYPYTQAANAESPHWYASPEWWLCILGVPTLIFVGYQSRLMAKHAEHFANLAKAATDNAKAAKDAAETAKATVDVLIASQRAFICFLGEGRVITRTDESGGSLGYEFQLSFENSGDTPALEVLMQFNAHWRPDDLPDDYPYTDFGALGNPMMIGPKARQFGIGPFVPREELNAMRDGKKKIYFYGWAEYRDIFFPKTPVRRTEYCFQLQRFEVVSGNDFMLQLTAHSNHNNAT
jgi:hypothetical protein